MDKDSSAWLVALTAQGSPRHAAEEKLHQILLRVALKEAYRRGPAAHLGGPALEDLAKQAADDAMVTLIAKLQTFRGECRFTTWAYSFVVLEIAGAIARDAWRDKSGGTDVPDWDRLPERYGAADPAGHRDLISAIQQAVATLNPQQQQLFVAIDVNGVSIDVVSTQFGSTPGAIYKTVFDARKKIRAYLTANGYLQRESRAGLTSPGQLGVGLA
ncbi:sigma-70 family RNA polymerase sigma factor [Leifsonia xyli]|uniref:sigma-70 family RNA polymerase sigma factor n=1 Tax=Leifsonia xyli TaxID=1575 RepID=UPI003D67E340